MSTEALIQKDVVNQSVTTSFFEELEELDFNLLPGRIRKAINELDLNQLYTCSKILVSKMKKQCLPTILGNIYKFDKDTYKHSTRVAEYSVLLGLEMGIKGMDLLYLSTGALLHDVGKLGVPESILNKTDKLNETEYDIIKRHPIIGKNVLTNNVINCPNEIIDIVFEHHENYDGSGYPMGKANSDISQFAMIIHICDVYDALVSKRCYKESFSKEYTFSLMDSMSGKQLNPEIYNKFREILLDIL